MWGTDLTRPRDFKERFPAREGGTGIVLSGTGSAFGPPSFLGKGGWGVRFWAAGASKGVSSPIELEQMGLRLPSGG